MLRFCWIFSQYAHTSCGTPVWDCLMEPLGFVEHILGIGGIAISQTFSI